MSPTCAVEYTREPSESVIGVPQQRPIVKLSPKTDAGRNILRMVQSRKLESSLPPIESKIVYRHLQACLCLGPHLNLKQFVIQDLRPQNYYLDLAFLSLLFHSVFLLPNLCPASFLSSQFIWFRLHCLGSDLK